MDLSELRTTCPYFCPLAQTFVLSCTSSLKVRSFPLEWTFKKNANIFSLIHHKVDFELEACWAFTATAHGKSVRDGIGATLKSTARRATLSKNILLSTAKDFFEFCQKQQLGITEKSNRDNPAIDVFYLEADEIEGVKNNILNSRFEKLQALREKKYLIYSS